MRWVAVLLLGAGLPSSADTGRRPRPEWYPTGVGTRWTFEYAGADVVYTVTGTRRIGSTDCAVIEGSYAGEPGWTIYLGRDAWGTRMFSHEQGGKTWDLDSPMPLIPADGRKDRRWTWKGIYYGTECESEITDLGEEEIEVLGRRTRCRKVHHRAEMPGFQLTTTYWYAAGMGPVRSLVEYTIGGGVSRQEMTLKEFRKP
jgi:hypothetical protein